ncbi:MAG: hypothetical protein IID15_04180 [Candidatus Marinimicrobia bacterium]|nr:hypothetical protein [Candidatus Neomarinimicrobiota bacterium]
MLKDNLDQLIALATSDHYADGIYDARQEHQKLTGEIYEDDKSYESRMAMFLEWYIYDRVLAESQMTPLESLIKENRNGWSRHELEIFEGFIRNIHGMFLVKKVRDDSIIVLNMFDDEKYEVKEEQGKLIFNKNDLFEARLMPYENAYYFSGNFCFHPGKALKFIKKEVEKVSVVQFGYKKELKKKESDLQSENKQWNKVCSKIDKMRTKLQNAKSEKKISAFKSELADLEVRRSEHEGRVAIMEKEIAQFIHEKIVREGRAAQAHLTQKLSYMHLKWERSRQIDLNDIYRN